LSLKGEAFRSFSNQGGKMSETQKHVVKKWEVSFIELAQNGKPIFKVTRRLAEMSVAETKLFDSKESAKKQFEEWLQ